MLYDAATKTVVLFGGGNGSGTVQFTDTWIWNGTTWKQEFLASAPPAQTLASVTYDAAPGVAVLFGGYSSTVVRSATGLLALAP